MVAGGRSVLQCGSLGPRWASLGLAARVWGPARLAATGLEQNTDSHPRFYYHSIPSVSPGPRGAHGQSSQVRIYSPRTLRTYSIPDASVRVST